MHHIDKIPRMYIGNISS